MALLESVLIEWFGLEGTMKPICSNPRHSWGRFYPNPAAPSSLGPSLNALSSPRAHSCRPPWQCCGWPALQAVLQTQSHPCHAQPCCAVLCRPSGSATPFAPVVHTQSPGCPRGGRVVSRQPHPLRRSHSCTSTASVEWEP